MTLDPAVLLQPIGADPPCGVDLHHDPAFRQLFEEAKGRRVEEYIDGKQKLVVEPPEWAEIKDKALGLAARTQDLRLWILLTRAATMTDGVAGAGAGLRLVAEGLQRHWPDLHPGLDEDEGDPVEQARMRISALYSLADEEGFLSDLRRAPLVRTPGLGSYSLRDLDMVAGRTRPAPDETPPDPARVDAAFKQCDPALLLETKEEIAAIPPLLDAIEAVFADRLGQADAAPDFSRLRRLVTQMTTSVSERVGAIAAVRGNGAAPPDQPGDYSAGTENDEGASPARAGAGTEPRMHGVIDSREDVLAALDRIIDYYRRKEPSSPIPLLLDRAKRLVPKDFLGLIEDLAPAAIKQVRDVGGLDGKGVEPKGPESRGPEAKE